MCVYTHVLYFIIFIMLSDSDNNSFHTALDSIPHSLRLRVNKYF